MKKIETLFVREGKGRAFMATPQVAEGCEWVIAGEGVATRKFDGTCCAVIGGRLYKRMDWDAAKGPAPSSWIHHSGNPDQRSGHGWMPVGEGPEDWMHRLASTDGLTDGTYELCGPKLQKNPEKLESYTLLRHGSVVLDAPRDFDGLRSYLKDFPHEGIVWHHPDGRMVKIKRSDFWR